MRDYPLARVVLAALSLLLVSHGFGAIRIVNMFDNSFNPLVSVIDVGDTVRWVNQGFNPHSTTSPLGLWDSEDEYPGGMDNGDTFDHTFNTPGDFRYHDSGFSSMTGLVRVVSANTQPTATITNLANGALFVGPTNLTIAASASDPGGSVAHVAFFVGIQSAGTAATAPYTATTNLSPGSYSITAVATDNLGAKGTSAPVRISVTVPIRFDTSTLVATGTSLRLSFSTTPGLVYALERASSLGGSNWTGLATNTAAGNSLSFSNSIAGQTNRFFRARLLPNP